MSISIKGTHTRRVGKPPYTGLATNINGRRFHFWRFEPARHLIGPGAEISFTPRTGELGFTDVTGKLLFDLRVQDVPGQGDVNFWERVFGLSGDLRNQRTITDPRKFLENLVSVARRSGQFHENLTIKTDAQGAVLLPHNGTAVPIMTGRDKRGVLPNRQVTLAPYQIGKEKVGVAIFPAKGPYHSVVMYNPELRRFYFESEGAEIYLAALHPVGTAHKVSLLGDTVYFTGRGRSTGEVVKVQIVNRHIQHVTAYTDGRPLPLRDVELESGEVIRTVGQIHVRHKLASATGRASAKLHRNGRQYNFIYGPHKETQTIKIGDVQRLGLQVGDELGLECTDGKVCVVTPKNGNQKGQILFIMNWVAEADGEFRLVDTSSSDVLSEKIAGVRVFEQTETVPRSMGRPEYAHFLTIAGRKIRLTVPVPWKPRPAPLSICVRDGAEVLFMRDSVRFTQREWTLLRRMVEVEKGLLKKDEISQKNRDRASGYARQAGERFSIAENNHLDVEGLEAAYRLYVEAYILDPFQNMYRDSALGIRKMIILRNNHFLARPQYKDYWEDRKRSLDNPAQWCRDTAQTLQLSCHNGLSIAYLLEVLAGLAEGKYNQESAPYQRMFDLLPGVWTQLQGRRRMYRALRTLHYDPRMAFIPLAILNSPPPGMKPLFERARKYVGCATRRRVQVNWEKQKTERKGRPISIDHFARYRRSVLRIANGTSYFIRLQHHSASHIEHAEKLLEQIEELAPEAREWAVEKGKQDGAMLLQLKLVHARICLQRKLAQVATEAE